MSKKLDFYSFSNKGYTGQVIHIEADVRTGFPGFDIIGLPDAAIKESRERVRTALRNCGFKFPTQRVLVSLSPASVPKSGSLLDLGIALAILFASQKRDKTHDLPKDDLFSSVSESAYETGNAAELETWVKGQQAPILNRAQSASETDKPNKTNNSPINAESDETIKIMAAGELALDGRIVEDYSVIGTIEAARKTGCSLCLIPYSKPGEKGIIKVSTLTEAFLKSGEILNKNQVDLALPVTKNGSSRCKPVFSDIIGLEKEKEILTLAAAGMHSILLFGPPGVGKTMLTTRLPLLLQDLDDETLSTVQHIYGCAGLAKNDSRPPVRLIPHDASKIQFTQGLDAKTPGDGALAHRGTVILDEITAYSKKLLETIKETYDAGFTLSELSGELVSFPAAFLLTGSMNACSCGNLGSPNDACLCTSHAVVNHWNKVGTPLLSRFDIRIPIEATSLKDHISDPVKPDSYYINKVSVAKERQERRYRDHNGIAYNGDFHISGHNALSVFRKEIELYCNAFQTNQTYNTREVIGIASLARTIADTNDKDEVSKDDIACALKLKRYGTGDYYWRTIK